MRYTFGLYEKLNQSIPVYTIVAEVLRILIKRRFSDFEFEHCANKNSARYLILQFLDRLTSVTSVRQDWLTQLTVFSPEIGCLP